MRACKIHGLNRTKTFHVKRFGTIGIVLHPQSNAATLTAGFARLRGAS